MTKSSGIIDSMTVKDGIGKSTQKANDEIAAFATELKS